MPKTRIGNSPIHSIAFENSNASKAYLGSVLIWERISNPSLVSASSTSAVANSSITWTIKNNYSSAATLYYTVNTSSTGTPDTSAGSVAAGASVPITVNDRVPGTTYYIHFMAVYDGQNSAIVSDAEVAPKYLMNTPSIVYKSRTTNSLTFTVTNNDATEAATVYATLNSVTKSSTNLAAGASADLTWTDLSANTSYTTSNVYAADYTGSNKLNSVNGNNTSGTTDKYSFTSPSIAFKSKTSSTTTSTIT